MNSVPFDPEHGGEGLPWTLSTALWEMWDAANMSFTLCPLSSATIPSPGAVASVETHARRVRVIVVNPSADHHASIGDVVNVWRRRESVDELDQEAGRDLCVAVGDAAATDIAGM